MSRRSALQHARLFAFSSSLLFDIEPLFQRYKVQGKQRRSECGLPVKFHRPSVRPDSPCRRGVRGVLRQLGFQPRLVFGAQVPPVDIPYCGLHRMEQIE